MDAGDTGRYGKGSRRLKKRGVRATVLTDLKAMNIDSTEMKRLADAVASVAATMAELFNEKLRTAGTGVFSEPDPGTNRAEYPNRYSPIPPNGRRCEFTGLGHAKLYQLLSPGGLARGQVRVANVRTPGTARGLTLFHVGDLLRFLDALAAAGRPCEGKPASDRVR